MAKVVHHKNISVAISEHMLANQLSDPFKTAVAKPELLAQFERVLIKFESRASNAFLAVTGILRINFRLRQPRFSGAVKSICSAFAGNPGQRHSATVSTNALASGSIKGRVLAIFIGQGGVLGQSEFFTLIEIARTWQTQHKKRGRTRATQP